VRKTKVLKLSERRTILLWQAYNRHDTSTLRAPASNVFYVKMIRKFPFEEQIIAFKLTYVLYV